MQDPKGLNVNETENKIPSNEVEQDLDANDVGFDAYEIDDDNYGSSTEKYGGYNGFSDDVIDDAFEGDPENTWNVD